VGILAEDVERVRSASPIDVVVGESVGLRRVGSRYVGLCPFHTEKTPSFSVNAELQVFHCFGCQASGDVITFVRETQNLGFREAVELLAGRAGIPLRYDDARTTETARKRSRLVEAVEQAVTWYHERLLTAPDAAHARGYLRSRGYDGDVVRRYRIGWAPDGWDELVKALRLSPDLAKEAGLGLVNSRNRLQDVFRARVLFPVFDARGDAVGFGGRVVPGVGRPNEPKYKNSPTTSLYDKSSLLYGLNWAKGEIVSTGEAVVCEGYTDVIGMARAGVGRAVGVCGTAMTERHLTALARFGRRLVLAFDADAAGQGAAERLYEWERKHGVELAVAALPPGSDPGDLAGSDPDALRAAVEGARPLLGARLDGLLAGPPAASPEARARVASAAAALIAEHPNEIVRESYAGQVAARLGVDPRHLLARPGAPRAVAPAAATPRAARVRESPALFALALAVQRPEAVAESLDEVLFDDPASRTAFAALAGAATFGEALATAEAEDAKVADLLRQAAVVEPPEDAEDVVALLARAAGIRALRWLEEENQRSSDPLHFQAEVGWLKRRLEELNETATRSAAVGQLVPFLRQRAQEAT
jgi:DNA primase